MKKLYFLSTLMLVMMAVMPLKSFAQTSFYQVCSTGQRLQYRVDSTGVSVSGGDCLTGDMVIPPSVTHDGITYDVTSIGSSAFSSCSGLTSITIPSSVTLIESKAFHKCVNLSSVRFEGITPPEFESAFYDVFPCIVDTIYVPEGCVENYSNAINNNSIVITDDHVGIDNHVVSNTLMVYPNPTSNIVNVECEMGNGESGDVTIQLYDIYGKLVGVNVVGANDDSPLQRATAQIDLSRYANGVYFIKAVANGHVMGIRKVVKQ